MTLGELKGRILRQQLFALSYIMSDSFIYLGPLHVLINLSHARCKKLFFRILYMKICFGVHLF